MFVIRKRIYAHPLYIYIYTHTHTHTYRVSINSFPDYKHLYIYIYTHIRLCTPQRE